MANLTAITPLDMDNWEFIPDEVWSAAAPGGGLTTSLAVAANNDTQQQLTWFGHAFFPVGNTPAVYGGTATHMIYFESYVIQYAISGLEHDMAVICGYIANANADLLPYLFGGADAMRGSSGADVLTGFDGNDAIAGSGGGDTLYGLKGRDTLEGGAGADTLLGGKGADRLDGEDGADELRGNGGADELVLSGSGANADVIVDFDTTVDRILLERDAFTRLGASAALAEGAFVSGAGVTQAQDAGDRIIYDTTTGSLYYDRNGTGAGAPVLIGTLTGSPDDLAAADFRVF